MIVYEVTAHVREDLCTQFERYMVDLHIPDVLATGFFKEASFETSSKGVYRMLYYSQTQDALETYKSTEAPRLRQDVSKHFPDGIELSRCEWTVLKGFA